MPSSRRLDRPDRPSVVYHVGAHKTGTSLIQKYFSERLPDLRAAGIFNIHRTLMNDYVGIGDELIKGPDNLGEALRAALEHPWATSVFASHENTIGRPFQPNRAGFYPRAQQNLAALAEVLEPHSAKVVLSIRPMPAFLESYYLQTINEGYDHSFQEWFADIDLDEVSWRPVVAALHEAFGRDAVELVDFRMMRAGQEAYLRHFLTMINPDFSAPISYDLIRNASLSGRGLAMARAANRHLTTDDERRTLRKFLQANFSNVHFPRPELFTPAQKQALHDRYDAEYEELLGTASVLAGPA